MGRGGGLELGGYIIEHYNCVAVLRRVGGIVLLGERASRHIFYNLRNLLPFVSHLFLTNVPVVRN